MTPDWQLPDGVDRNLWNYLQATEMIAGYESQMASNPLAQWDIPFCLARLAPGSRIIDLGCGTGRLAIAAARAGHQVVALDLSAGMLEEARRLAGELPIRWHQGHLLDDWPEGPFDAAVCLFSTWGMLRGPAARQKLLHLAAERLRPGGKLILHAHHRGFYRLKRSARWKQIALDWLHSPDAGDWTELQAYGSPLTLHHTTANQLEALFRAASFDVVERVALDEMAGEWRRDRRPAEAANSRVGSIRQRIHKLRERLKLGSWRDPKIYGFVFVGQKPKVPANSDGTPSSRAA